jgi:Ca-activated chloride channel homolog
MKTIKQILLLMIFLLGSCLSFAGGFIIVAPFGSGMPDGTSGKFLEVRSLKVETNITGLTAVTNIDQVFYNPSSRAAEAWFVFPVPKNSHISTFSMDINGKQTKAELLDADKARQIYEDIVRKMKDPALLEYADQAMYKVRIFPFEAKSEKRIKISYRELLVKDNNTISWILPLNTEKHSGKAIKNFSIKVEIKSQIRIASVFSPSHVAEFVRGEDELSALVGFEKQNVKSDKDFKLFINLSESDFGLSLLAYEEENTEASSGYFFMNLSPALSGKKQKVIPKDISFVLDISGSMSGDKMIQAKEAISYCVKHLNANDRFEIVKFSTVAEALFGELKPADSKNKEQAEKYIDRLEAIGGTNMQEAFELAFGQNINPNRPHIMVFITDGKPTIGTTDTENLLEKIKSVNTGRTRIFTFGLGNDINTILLDKITTQSRAYRTYIAEGEDITLSISDFFNKINAPVLTNIEISAEGIDLIEMYPRNFPDLFAGSSVQIFGKYKGEGKAEIALKGKVQDKNKQYAYKVSFSPKPENDFIPVFWAGRKIGFLLDEIRQNGEQKELTDEIKALALKYGIITPYTSYLILEDEKIRISEGEISQDEAVFYRRFGNRTQADDFLKKSKNEFADIGDKSGGVGAQRSKEIQSQTNVSNVNELRPGSERMTYTDNEGNSQNFAEQSEIIQGRAVYRTGDRNIDSQLFTNKCKKEKRLKFAGNEYFAELKRNPDLGQFLALGKNLQFNYRGTLYIIEE